MNDKPEAFRRVSRFACEELSPREAVFVLLAVVAEDEKLGVQVAVSSNAPIETVLKLMEHEIKHLREHVMELGDEDEAVGHA